MLGIYYLGTGRLIYLALVGGLIIREVTPDLMNHEPVEVCHYLVSKAWILDNSINKTGKIDFKTPA